MTLTKADLVEKVHQALSLPKKEAVDIVEELFSLMKESLSKGDKIKISGFGNFVLRDKSSRQGRNPQTGESLKIAARRVLTFKPSSLLREDITERYAHRLDELGNEDLSLAPKAMDPRSVSARLNLFEEDEE